MEYEELLKRAIKNLPKKTESRFEIPNAIVITGKKQTEIRNFVEIARILRRQPADIAKFLFKALASAGSMRGADLVLQSKVQGSLVNQRIREYAKDFVMCRECGKPDTSLQKMDNYIFIKCEACGAKRPAPK
jgi:translation initiation factor 2 subunit 2